jgi:hypothetical protein
MHYSVNNPSQLTVEQLSINDSGSRRNHNLFLLFLIIFLLVLSSKSSLSQDIPVKIKADKLRYIDDKRIVEASGSVEARLKEVTIRCDFLTMDSNSKIATAQGNVFVFSKNYDAESSRLIYDANLDVSNFSNFYSELNPERIKGKLYLSADELEDHNKEMIASSAGLSTCENHPPHYFLTASKVEYFPDDKIIAYNVIVFVGEIPVMWLPVLYYDFSEGQRQNFVIGHNKVEGNYIKSSWFYPLGLLFLDQMEKKGFGHGTEINYGLGALGLGTFFIYHLDEQDTKITDWVTRIKHTKQLDPWTTLKLEHDYTKTYLVPSGRRDQTAFGLNLGHNNYNDYNDKSRWEVDFKTFDDAIADLGKLTLGLSQAQGKAATDYNLNYQFSKKAPEWIRSSQRLTHSQPLWSDQVKLSTRVNYNSYVKYAGEPADERLEPMVEIAGKEKNFSWRIYENWYFDLDEDKYTQDDQYQYLEKQPEIEISPDPLNLSLFTLRSKFGYGRYREVRYVSELGGMRDFATQRYGASFDLSRSVPLALGTVATLALGLDQFLYGPGDQLYAYSESAKLRTNLFGFFRNDFNYRKGTTAGNTPFLFDRLGTNYHDFREIMTFYYLNNFRWAFDSGYNWRTSRWLDVNTNLLVKPDRNVYWNLRTGWDIENKKYKDMINLVSYAPFDFLAMQFSTVSDLNNGELKSGSALYDMFFLKDEPNQLHFRFSQVYDYNSKDFKVRDIMLVKELHCWELKYTYSDLRKDFSVSFSLKALPQEPVGISTSRGFYIDSFEKEYEKFRSEKVIRRY